MRPLTRLPELKVTPPTWVKNRLEVLVRPWEPSVLVPPELRVVQPLRLKVARLVELRTRLPIVSLIELPSLM